MTQSAAGFCAERTHKSHGLAYVQMEHDMNPWWVVGSLVDSRKDSTWTKLMNYGSKTHYMCPHNGRQHKHTCSTEGTQLHLRAVRQAVKALFRANCDAVWCTSYTTILYTFWVLCMMDVCLVKHFVHRRQCEFSEYVDSDVRVHIGYGIHELCTFLSHHRARRATMFDRHSFRTKWLIACGRGSTMYKALFRRCYCFGLRYTIFLAWRRTGVHTMCYFLAIGV